tara:strand:- start:646 stop:870 length:225 start_codon:yes stop_codon:yes gene_type:complete
MFESIIPCGGKGTGIKSGSKAIPEDLMPIHDVPFLFHLKDQVAEKIVERIALCTRYGNKIVQQVIGTSYRQVLL